MIKALELSYERACHPDESISKQIENFFLENKESKFISASYTATFTHGLSHYALVIYDDGA